MRRAFWFAAGAGAGVYAMTKARRAAEAFTPEGLADRLAGLSLGAHLFGEELRAGMTEKENELRHRLELGPDGTPDDPDDDTDTRRLTPGPALRLTRKDND